MEFVRVMVAYLEDVETFPVTVNVIDVVPEDPELLLIVSQDASLEAVQSTLEEIDIDEDDCAPQFGYQMFIPGSIDARN